MHRRRFLATLIGSLTGLFVARRARPTAIRAASPSPASAAPPTGAATPVGTPYPLVALPGKAPLGQVYDRPPNYETPTLKLIGEKNYPFTDTEYYYVRYREAQPAVITPEAFRLQVDGDSVQKPLTLTLKDLQGFPRVEVGAVGECTGLGRGLLRPLVPGVPWTKGDLSCAMWAGASLKAILDEAGIKPGAVQVAFRSGGTTIAFKKPQYWRVYPLATVLQPDALLAYEMNGGEIPLFNGAPVRLVVPGSYAPLWVKQLVEIEVRSTPQPMEWSGRPMSAAKIKTYSLITAPADGTQVPMNAPLTLTGLAWDGGQGIAKVEVSLDDGKTWEGADVEKSYGTYVWRVWHHTVQPPQAGEFRILSRATSVDGATQPMDPDPAVLKNGGRQNNAIRTFAAVLTGM